MPAAWFPRALPSAVDRLRAAGHSRRVAELLAIRGIETAAEAGAFLSPGAEQLHRPAELLGMGTAVELLRQAHGERRKVVVFGDYDVDGICATALLLGSFRALGFAVEAMLPSRRTGGYGLQVPHVRRVAELGAGLLVTADCGMKSHDAIAEARRSELPVIVTDHHLAGEGPPGAAAVINPKQPGCSYPCRELCGSGVAMKLAAAMFQEFEKEPPWGGLLRLACLGTIADSVELRGENRAIAKLGLTELPRTPSPGLLALFERAQLRDPISASDVAFRIAPRLNAPGRVGDPDSALELLLTRDPARGRRLADEIEDANRARQQLERQVLRDCEELLRDDGRSPLLIAWSEAWHRGVVGIAAGRIARERRRPVVLLACGDDGLAVGSGRSVEGLDLYSLLAPQSAICRRFGGHAQAIGLTVERSRLEELAESWREALAGTPPELLDERLEYDLELNGDELTTELLEALAKLSPFGTGHPEPVFRFGPLSLLEPPRRFGNGHLALRARGAGRQALKIVAWNQQESTRFADQPFEILGCVEADRYGSGILVRLVAARTCFPAAN